MNARFSSRAKLALAVLPLTGFGLGCATTGASTRSETAGAHGNGAAVAQPGRSGSEAPQISTRARLMFEDANKAAEAQRRARNPDYPSLERKYQAALDADPQLAEAEYDLGVLADRQGKTDLAIAHYQAAVKKKPSLWQAVEGLGVIAQNRGDLANAQRLYAQVLAIDPDNAAARARLAEIYRQAGDQDKAMEYARAALEREPKSLTAYKVMMLSYLDRKQYSLAKLVALRATKIDDGDPELYFTVGQILEHEGDLLKAKAQYKRSAEVNADYLPAQTALARLALKGEDYPAAEQHLRKVLQLGGKSAEVHLDLGVAYKGMAQIDRAMQEYDAAEKLDPNLAAIYLNRGILLSHHKDAPERAVELFKKYIALSGGEDALSHSAPVFGLIREAQQAIAVKAEAKKVEEEAKRAEELAKQQQEAAKKQQQAPAPKAPAPGAPPNGQPQPASGNAVKAAAPATVQAPAKPAESKDEPGGGM